MFSITSLVVIKRVQVKSGLNRYEIAKEIVHNDALDREFIATDYFDASINRISAWVTGMRKKFSQKGNKKQLASK